MSPEDEFQSAETTAKTARTVGQLVKYSREVNQSDTVAEVASYAMEATVHVMEGHPMPTVFEVTGGDVRVLESMAPAYTTGESAGPVATRALVGGETVVAAGPETALRYEDESLLVVPPDGFDGEAPAPAVSIGAPSLRQDADGETSGVVLLVQWDALDAIEEYHVKPVEYLADHVATAVANIRSRERLERARNDLAQRKEMIEMYDRLLRHDLGNDLQIITGYADTLLATVDGEDDDVAEYAETINRTARDAADLIGRVGDLVKTLEAAEKPEARQLEPILTDVVEAVEAKFDTLTIEYDPAAVDVSVYAGDLLDSVFQNVLSNAAVHNEGPVTVAVTAADQGPGTITVSFADDGGGVPEDLRNEILEIGKKGPDSDGTGFGLGIARALVESYGGTVEVTDSDLGGADVRITLDRA
jgi:signal transduction histidine kinase